MSEEAVRAESRVGLTRDQVNSLLQYNQEIFYDLVHGQLSLLSRILCGFPHFRINLGAFVLRGFIFVQRLR